MNLFKHRHKFPRPYLEDYWKQIHKEIFVNGNTKTNIDVYCKCGIKKSYSITPNLIINWIGGGS